MTNLQRSITTTVGLALVGVYSWIMIGSNGSASSWAWLMLVGAFASLAAAAGEQATKDPAGSHPAPTLPGPSSR